VSASELDPMSLFRSLDATDEPNFFSNKRPRLRKGDNFTTILRVTFWSFYEHTFGFVFWGQTIFSPAAFSIKIVFHSFCVLSVWVCIFLAKGNCCKSCLQNIGEINYRCQFYQHFMSNSQWLHTWKNRKLHFLCFLRKFLFYPSPQTDQCLKLANPLSKSGKSNWENKNLLRNFSSDNFSTADYINVT